MRRSGGSATLRDVALEAGVSTKTASRVLNNDPLVAPGTRATVLKTMERLEYRPDPAARSLRAGKDQTIGLIIDSVGDIFFSEMAAAIERAFVEDGYRVLISSSNRDFRREKEIAAEFLRRRCAGLIITPSFKQSLQDLPTGDVPVVFVDRPGYLTDAVSVIVDDYGLARVAVEHMIAHGSRRIALISDVPLAGTTKLRRDGYLDAIADAGLDVDESLIRDECADASAVPLVMRDLLSLEEPPDAIFSTNTRLSASVISELRAHPDQEVAFVAFGDFTLAASLVPGVTVIDHSATVLGMAAADSMRELLKARESEEMTEIDAVKEVPCELIVRGSGEIHSAAARDAGQKLVGDDTNKERRSVT